MASLGVNSILIRDITILDKWFSDRKKKCKYLTFRRDHRMSHVHLPVENVDKKRLAKGEINIKDCMTRHVFVYTPNKDIIMLEYLSDCKECLCLNFLSCVKNTSKFIEIRAMTL